MKKVGIELGIRAPLRAIQKAALIADTNNLNYYFVPETNPNYIGVDAFKAIYSLIGKITKTKLGTGIVNVFSRSREEILDLSLNLYSQTNQNFVLGLGTSAPVIVEKMYKIKFEKPVSRLRKYTQFLKSKYAGPIFWAAVGNRITDLATEHADGIIFFLKPPNLIRQSVRKIESRLTSLGKSIDSFEIISIRPTFINQSIQQARNEARFTLAAYIGANEFYSKPLAESGFEKEIHDIRENFRTYGILEASEKVSDKLIEELTTFGTVDVCKNKLREYFDRTGAKTTIIGFDLPKEDYNEKFFANLAELVSNRK